MTSVTSLESADRAVWEEYSVSLSHHRDVPPVDGGRWGISVVFTPDEALAMRLDALTDEAMAAVGREHWPTGCRAAVHFTVRALEAHRADATFGDPLVVRCVEALRRAARLSEPVRLRLSGLTLTPSGVMVCGYPVDGAADDFAARLRVELGVDSGFEEHFERNIWYATLVHFTAAVEDPQVLVDWVAERRDADLGEAVFGEAELVRFAHDGRQPIRVRLGGGCLGYRG